MHRRWKYHVYMYHATTNIYIYIYIMYIYNLCLFCRPLLHLWCIFAGPVCMFDASFAGRALVFAGPFCMFVGSAANKAWARSISSRRCQTSVRVTCLRKNKHMLFIYVLYVYVAFAHVCLSRRGCSCWLRYLWCQWGLPTSSCDHIAECQAERCCP